MYIYIQNMFEIVFDLDTGDDWWWEGLPGKTLFSE